jgi:hypothetical protein
MTSTEAARTETAAASKPMRCLAAVGLIDARSQDVGEWRGFQSGRSYSITVHRLEKPAKAPNVVAGTYAVAGPFKVAARGRGLTTEQGLEADAVVQEVADCLGR